MKLRAELRLPILLVASVAFVAALTGCAGQKGACPWGDTETGLILEYRMEEGEALSYKMTNDSIQTMTVMGQEVPIESSETFEFTVDPKGGSDEDFGIEVKNVCKTGCIGCKACTKVEPELVTMKDNVPVFNYDDYEADETKLIPIVDKCKMESLIFVGKPTAEDLAAVADEHVPDQIRADFETTVDKTDWLG